MPFQDAKARRQCSTPRPSGFPMLGGEGAPEFSHRNVSEGQFANRQARRPIERGRIDALRRFHAVLLLALLSISLLSPALTAGFDSNLPACCRRDGKHKCSMAVAGGPMRPGVGFRANNKCPMYPGGGLAPASSSIAPIAPATSLTAPAIRQTARIHFSQRILSTPHTRAHPKRGPPSLPIVG